VPKEAGFCAHFGPKNTVQGIGRKKHEQSNFQHPQRASTHPIGNRTGSVFDASDVSLIGARTVKRSETKRDLDYFLSCSAPGCVFLDVVELERHRPRLSAQDLIWIRDIGVVL
jgi:hypothetical protein